MTEVVAPAVAHAALPTPRGLSRGAALRSVPTLQPDGQSKRTIIFLLSTNFAGSHYASLLLGSHSKIAHIGEAKRIRKSPGRKPVCNACGDAEHCRLFDGCSAENIDQLHARAFDNLGPAIEALVDTSKQPRWAERFLGLSDYQLRFIHLVRDPRALVRRWALGNPTFRRRLRKRLMFMRQEPRLAWRVALATQHKVYMYKWLAQNRSITRFLNENQLEHRVVTYQDLAKEPARELELLMEWLHFKFEPDQIDYWKFEHHGSQKTEYEWVKKGQARFFDARWRESLSPEVSSSVVRHPGVARYVASLGLRFTEDGLTQR